LPIWSFRRRGGGPDPSEQRRSPGPSRPTAGGSALARSGSGHGGRGLGRIDHFVVLMMENRSFDNMAGWLYAPHNRPPFDRPPRGQPFEGLAGRRLANPVPPDVSGAEGGLAPVGWTTRLNNPDPDPGEGFAHTHTQLYGVPLPPAPPVGAASGPPVPDAGPWQPAPMDGFVRDYAAVLKGDGGPVTYDRVRGIMDGFPPSVVPVISHLANAYAICDQWHCSVPSQTFANRSFSLAATSSGQVDNQPYTGWLHNDAVTLMERIESAGRPDLTWRVYYDPLQILPLTWLIFPRLRPYLVSRFATMGDFWHAAAAGTLPAFCLIEPRLLIDHNDEHPPFSVKPGEDLIARVYAALSRGPLWPRTLMILTYDEHGGCFDHVPPPPAVPPEDGAPAGQYGFRFDLMGVRVPTVLISPWIRPGTVFRARDARGREVPLEHTAIIRTVCRRFGLAPLTRRDTASPDLAAALNLRRPRRDEGAVAAALGLGERADGVPAGPAGGTGVGTGGGSAGGTAAGTGGGGTKVRTAGGTAEGTALRTGGGGTAPRTGGGIGGGGTAPGTAGPGAAEGGSGRETGSGAPTKGPADEAGSPRAEAPGAAGGRSGAAAPPPGGDVSPLMRHLLGLAAAWLGEPPPDGGEGAEAVQAWLRSHLDRLQGEQRPR
jgi:phospholipase C